MHCNERMVLFLAPQISKWLKQSKLCNMLHIAQELKTLVLTVGIMTFVQ